MSDVVTVALIVTVGGFITLFISNWQRKNAQREDWARQDQVAAQAAEAARLLLAANEQAARQAAAQNDKLDEIHTLVNSNLTEAVRGQLTATIGQVVALRRALGENPTDEELAEITAVQDHVTALTMSLHQRDEQTRAAVDEAAKRTQVKGTTRPGS